MQLIKSIEDLAFISETNEIECKLAIGKDGKGKLPDDFWPTYSSFANTHGGIIILGVKEKELGKFETVGIGNAEQVITDLFNTANNKQKVNINILNDTHVTRLPIGNKEIIIIQIPIASRRQKPVYLNGNPFGNTYRRLKDGDTRYDEESVKRMLAEQLEDARDNHIVHDFGLPEIEENSLRLYRQMLQDKKPEHPFLEHEGIDFLKQIGGWRRDRSSGESGLTLAGLLCLVNGRQFRMVPHTFFSTIKNVPIQVPNYDGLIELCQMVLGLVMYSTFIEKYTVN